MPEFNNRIAAQRHVLEIVNSSVTNEELFGLSSKAIERWIAMNKLETSSQLVLLIKTISAKLFFLANKSQEQVTEEYQTVADEIADLSDRIQQAVRFEKTKVSKSLAKYP